MLRMLILKTRIQGKTPTRNRPLHQLAVEQDQQEDKGMEGAKLPGHKGGREEGAEHKFEDKAEEACQKLVLQILKLLLYTRVTITRTRKMPFHLFHPAVLLGFIQITWSSGVT